MQIYPQKHKRMLPLRLQTIQLFDLELAFKCVSWSKYSAQLEVAK